MKWLLDTCVVSEFAKPAPEPRVVQWLHQQPYDDLALSVLTVGEIEKGIQKLPESPKKNRLLSWLGTEVMARFEGRLLDVDIAVAKRWAHIDAESESKGRPLAAIDGLIAATGLVHQLTLVTRDTPDMEAIGVPLFNPWNS